MFKKLWLLIVIGFMLVSYAFAALFTSPTTKVYSGVTDISVPVSLNTQGDQVAAFNSTIQFDTTKLVFKGASTALANKTIEYNQIAPGQIKIIMFGLNADALINGKVFDVIFDIVQGVGGQVTVTFADTVGAKPDATAVTVTIDPIVFDVVLKGDLDNDGFVNAQDIMIMVQQLLMGTPTLPLETLDINQDGTFNVRDLQALINIVLG